ncbi:hypothetical protein TSAR_016545 [Trichomalopsis sarcophagae]|uniref:Fanconi anemia group D2 protein n=1 Tax=Trichomalopsis sarcophagae TaxID=543379 RepID=A0A232F0B4_9HYME|nr:hypothetical protein TSAR_016545 [Trichomalopsis sarcophagae]
MDRRKIKSKNVLHKQLYSSSQTVTRTVAEPLKDNIVRSVSAAVNLPVSRKRKNSEDEEDEAEQEEDADPPVMSSSIKSGNLRKKRRSGLDDDDNENSEDEPSSPKRAAPKSDRFVKPKTVAQEPSTARKRSNNSDKDEVENQHAGSSGSSYIRGILESMDKSPSKLSQSSTSSVEKYRKINLRTPLRPKLQKPVSKTIAEKNKASQSQKAQKSQTDPRLNRPGPASKKKNTSLVSSDADLSDSEVRSDPRISRPGPASKKKNTSLVSSDEDKNDSEIKKSKPSSKKKNTSIVDSDTDPSDSEVEKPSPACKKKKTSKILSSDSDETEIDNKKSRPVTKKKNTSIVPSGSKSSRPGPASKKNTSFMPSDSDATGSEDEPNIFESDRDSSPIKSNAKKNKNVGAQDTSANKNNQSKTKNNPAKSNKSPVKAQKTPPDNQRSRVLDSPELSPLRSFHSPEKNINTRRKKVNNNQSDEKFIDFLNSAGITLYSGPNLHVANDDPREVIHKMKKLLSSDSIDLEEIVRSWNGYIEDEENLQKSLIELKIETEDGVALSSKAVSLSRILLQVPELQVKILNSLFIKLIDAVIASDSSDDAPWALQMLQQFRFLEVQVEPEILITRMEELLSSSPEWFQREVIAFIPDIVTDIQHRTTAEMLIKIMEKNSDLTNIILDCIHNLSLGKDYREELREQVLGLLNKNIDKSTIPAITRFVLNACASEVIAIKSFNALRGIDMSPSPKEIVEECYTNQTFMVNAMKMSIQLFKEVSQAAVVVVKSVESEAVPLDLIISILLYETTSAKKKIIEATVYSHIKDSYYKTSLLGKLYTAYKQVAKSFQATALSLAIHLLRADSPVHVEFGIEWLRNMFISQSDTSYKQREIMEKLLNLMGSKDKTVKNALEVLCRMANDENERRYLQQHAGFLRSFLEKIDNLQFEEVSTLYHLLHGLCTQSELISNILNDDLSIIMQKQLCSSKVTTKCKGVLGAVMAIKHLSCDNETSEQAVQLLKKTFSSIKGCFKSKALFFDELGQVIATTNEVDEEFLNTMTVYLEDIFVNTAIVDTQPDNLVPTFGLNDSEMGCNYFVHFGSDKTGAFVPVFFKLLRISYLRLSDDLESVNAMLGCPVLMPDDLDMPEPTTADYMIYCINWFRELISGFVTQNENLLKQQVLKRLESLMSLQGEFVTMVAMLDSRYQPPPCYFNYFPVPSFLRLDKKIGKKGGKRGKKKDKPDGKSDLSLNKSVMLPEWESWELGSELTVKNPAFFRRMDTKIINLLDVNMDIHSSQADSNSITIAQVCFIVKEILGMFENQTSENFMRDLIQLLPKICSKLKKIIDDLRQNDSAHEKEAVRLLVCLLNTIFSWKEFQSARYNTLLRDGLRTLAGMMNASSAMLRTCKDLVAEAYKYFESLADIATQISLAVAFVNMCGCLMNHSNSFTEQSKDKQAKMAYGFLCLEWNNDTPGPQYKAAIKELLNTWLNNEPNPLKTVSSVLEWLPEEALSLERPQSRLSRLPSVTKVNFHLLLKQLFTGIVKGIDISLGAAESDPERIRVWMDVGLCLEKMANICKANKNNSYLVLFLRYTTILYQKILSSGMKLLETNVKYQSEEVLEVIKLFQRSGRFLRDIFCTARKEKIVSLLTLIPLAKSRREQFIYRVKGILTANNSISAFWMGNLLNKDLDGEEIASESSEDITAASDLTTETNAAEETGSEIFGSESEDDVEIEE